jgi:hypothetical protein
MFSGKRFALIATIALSLIIPMQSPASADYNSDKNAVENTLQPEQEMFWLTEPTKNSQYSRYTGGSGEKPWTYNFAGAESLEKLPISHIYSSLNTVVHCEGWNDPNCRGSNSIVSARLYLPPCIEDSSSSCIDSLKISVKGVSHSVTPIRSTETKPVCRITEGDCPPAIQNTKFPGVPRFNIPAASSPSLWKAEISTNAADTDTFLVSSHVFVKANLDKKGNISNVTFTDFEASVVPYKEISGEFKPGVHNITTGRSHFGSHGLTGAFRSNETDHSGCVWHEDSKCGVAAAFLPDTRVELSLKVPKEIDGWLQGRMANANVEIVSADKNLNKIVITGDTIELPVSGTFFHPDTTSGFGGPQGLSTDVNYIFNWDAEGVDNPMGGHGARMLTMFEKELGDRAIGRVSLWSISLIQSAYTCEKKKTPRLEGLLTTNAMVYNGGLPTYKKGTLSYQVGGLHYNHDGTVFKGSYDFIMRSDTARCIYGFTKAPVQVAVTVTDVNGVPSASTSSVSESGGWLRIRARDFTFSTPTINAKITQKLSTSVKNDKISQKALAKIAKVSIGKKDKVTVSVSGGNKKFAKVTSGNVSFKKNGTYQVKIKVKHHKGNTETATITVKVK